MKETFHNPTFKLRLTALMVRDEKFMMDAAHLLDAEDFHPTESGESNAPWLIASMAIEHWTKYKEPIGKFLGLEIKKRIKENAWSKRLVGDLRGYYAKVGKAKLKGAQYILDQLIDWRKFQLRTRVISELIDLHGGDNLTDARFIELCTEAVSQNADAAGVSTVFSFTGDAGVDFKTDARSLYHRSLRRQAGERSRRYPLFMIPPLDTLVRGIGRGHLGMIMAPTGRGKSMGLAHLGVTLALQGWNVLYFTLEDPLEDLEDRVDTFVSNMRIKDLANEQTKDGGPVNLRSRFLNFRRAVKGNMRLVDCTKVDISLAEIEAIWDRQRQQNGWTADAVIIDYDEIVKPESNKDQRRFELDNLYKGMIQFARRSNVLVWTAAQTNANAETKEGLLAGADLAEHKGKLRHCTLALSLGLAPKEWPPDTKYLGVLKHRNDKSFVGCHIVSDPERMRIYDYAKTIEAEDDIDDTPKGDMPDDGQPKENKRRDSLDDLAEEEDELL